MSESLRRILNKYLDVKDPNNEYRDIIIKEYEEKIKKEILDNEIDLLRQKQYEIQKKIEDEAKKAKLNERINYTEEVIFSAIIMAFFIGLFVNQTTEIIDEYKIQFEVSNIAIIIVLLIINCIVYKMYCSNKVNKLIKDFLNKNDN